MTLRVRGRVRFVEILVLFAALTAVAMSIAALAPHDEVEGSTCLVCKASSQPFETTVTVTGLPPSLSPPSCPVELSPDRVLPALERICSSRAPPV